MDSAPKLLKTSKEILAIMQSCTRQGQRVFTVSDVYEMTTAGKEWAGRAWRQLIQHGLGAHPSNGADRAYDVIVLTRDGMNYRP